MLNVFCLIAAHWERRVLRPRRVRALEAQKAPFLCRTPDGLRFVLDPGELIDREIAVEGIYERRFLRFFKRILPRDAVMIDVGANIGNHALYLHKICSAVHCFEPNPPAAKRLRHHIALNGATNVHVHEVGLGDCDATLPFASNVSGNLGNSGFFAGREPATSNFKITDLPVRRADHAISELGLRRIDFIKIDVEGLEPEIFLGLEQIITCFRPLFAFEYHGHLTPLSSFEQIRKSLPGYRFAELFFPPNDGGALARLRYRLRHGYRPVLRRVQMPQQRTYETLLAVPNEHPLARVKARGAGRTFLGQVDEYGCSR